MGFVLAIDGPAGSGKGTIAKLLSERLNLVNIDTGAMYRCVALACLRKNITETQIEEIVNVLENIKIELKREDDIQKVYLNNADVTSEIRTTEVDNCVAKFAAIKEVRDKITPMQREMGKTANIVMEGRDIGTVVFPDADVKIFLECSVEERANRRYKQNLEKGIECSYEEVLNSIKERHILETQRKIAPFVKADDAILVDSTELSIEEVVEKIVNIIENKKEN
ncbi:MAG: (d)CMP kinase [Clostridia bacterium]|nr:(d)CMP kinase [Clostridia bacterium]